MTLSTYATPSTIPTARRRMRVGGRTWDSQLTVAQSGFESCWEGCVHAAHSLTSFLQRAPPPLGKRWKRALGDQLHSGTEALPCQITQDVSLPLAAASDGDFDGPDQIWKPVKGAQHPTHHGVQRVVPIGRFKRSRNQQMLRSSTCGHTHTNGAAAVQEHISGARRVALCLHVSGYTPHMIPEGLSLPCRVPASGKLSLNHEILRLTFFVSRCFSARSIASISICVDPLSLFVTRSFVVAAVK